MGTVDKWKIFNNLRRSLSPVCTLLALVLGMCLPGPAFTATAAAVILSAWSNLLLSGAKVAFRGGQGVKERYHATVIAGFGGMILQTLLQLLFLPIQAWTCASTIAAALWRQGISHRRMLDWVTAADAKRRMRDRIRANYRRLWPAALVGLAAMVWSMEPAGRALGLEGRFGLYEAADFTPARTAGEARFEPVRCFMAHHLGMSLLTIDNALQDNIMQKRFLAHPAMKAFRELLEEKVPVGAKPLKIPGGQGNTGPARRGGHIPRFTFETFYGRIMFKLI